MLAEKKKIEAALNIMEEKEIKSLWSYIQANFKTAPKSPSWETIETDTPTNNEKLILECIDEYDTDFISQDELLKQLNIAPAEVISAAGHYDH